MLMLLMIAGWLGMWGSAAYAAFTAASKKDRSVGARLVLAIVGCVFTGIGLLGLFAAM